jgi:hypothetical protein
MNAPARDYSSIPASACTLVVGEFELGDNGAGAKSAPVKLVARSGKPIEHWFWGRVVHDLAGMRLHKPRLPIDYVHDAKEVIGYLNKFDTSSGDLVTTGALVPFKDSDRATEILHKTREGVPYEASINFGGDGLKIQEIPDGQVADVNGYKLDGPAVIVREWPLRGVAICPYGADMNTESTSLTNKSVFAASVITAPEPEATTKDLTNMSNPVEVEAKVEAPEAATEQAQTPVEEKPAEAAPVEKPAEAVEAAQTEGEAQEPAPAKELTREEFTKIADEFGAEIAVQTVRDGGDYSTALRLHADALKSENNALRAELAAAKESSTGQPAKVVEAKKPVRLFNTGK